MEKPDTPIKVSVCIVAHNEEQVIRMCLNSIAPIADEIIFVHDGEPSDRTVEIAKEYTDKIFTRPKVGYLEGNLPFVYSQCTGEWVMQIDADEQLSPELQAVIPSLISRDDVDGFSFSIPSMHENKIRDRDLVKPLLFRRTKAFAYGLPHFVRGVNGKMEKRSEKIIHQPGYDNYSWDIFRTKWLGLARKHAQLLLLPPEKLPVFGPINVQKIRLTNKRIRRMPRLYALYKFTATWVYSFLHHRWWLPQTLRRTFMYACYEFAVYWYVWRYQHVALVE